MRIIDELKQQVENEMKKFDMKLAARKYIKITETVKEKLIHTVLKDH